MSKNSLRDFFDTIEEDCDKMRGYIQNWRTDQLNDSTAYQRVRRHIRMISAEIEDIESRGLEPKEAQND